MTTEASILDPDRFVFEESMLTACVKEILASMSSAELPSMDDDAPIMVSLQLVTADLSILLMAAKTLDDDRDFDDAFGVIRVVDLRAYDGFICRYVRAMLAKDCASGEDASYVDDCIDPDRLKQRIRMISQFYDRLAIAT